MSKINIIFFILLVIPLSIFSQENQLAWPREIDTKDGGMITIYQPQLDSFSKEILQGRIAISIKPVDEELVFCSAWFKARMSTDKDKRTVSLEAIDISKVYFPDMDDESKIIQLKRLLKTEIESWEIMMSLDRLLASLNEVDDLENQSVKLNNDPPEIYFRTSPTMLISIDGEPILKKIDNSNLEYVVNTPFFIVKEQNKESYYINDGKFWHVANTLSGDWKETKKVPSDIEKLAKDNIQKGEPDSISASITEAPALIIVTKPAELIITDGEPDYAPIAGTFLLYAKNSENDIIMDISSQKHYILIAGRWYKSKTLKDGDWIFSEPEDLPEDFAKIPEESDMTTVRASIPGTPEAQDALLEQSIPQTATVNRKEAKVEVTYDGNPEFKKVEGTEIYYAANTDKTVLRIKSKYYCVDEAIWFVSTKATGPWEVSDVRPDEVDELSPSSEVYNVKFVYIYDSTPEVVYVGYYPGYTYSYVYGGVIVYGTGYWYHPWYRHYYYPRPVTYGFGVHWNPRTGWGFSYGLRVSWRFHPHRGLWGPRGYRHGYRHGYHRGYRHGAKAGYRAGYRASQKSPSSNVYRNRSTGIKKTGNVKTSPKTGNMNTKARPSTKPNNMYTDKKGNVYQRNNTGSWDQKSNKKTSPNTSQKPSTVPKSNSVNNQSKQLNRSHQNRSTGNTNYNRSRTNTTQRSQSRPSGGRRR